MQVTTGPLFAVELTPHRSMSPKGLRVVVGLIALFCALPGLVFFSLGAWPIVGFMGLDLVAIGFAFWVSFQSGKRREVITLWSDRLEVTATDAKGQAQTALFDPAKVRLIVARDFDERTTGLRLREADHEIEFGAFLTQDEKSGLAKVFGTALRKARR